MSAFSLTSFPEELISNIAYWAPTSTQARLALTSKQLNRITTPHLYRHISLPQVGLTKPDYDRFYNLVILLLSRRDYAALTHHLTIRVSRRRQWNADKALRCDDLHPILRDAIMKQAANRMGGSRGVGDVMVRDREAIFLALLLNRLPNLQTLDKSIDRAHDVEEEEWLMRQLHHPFRLRNLRDLVLVSPEPEPSPSLDMEMARFNLPSLRRVFLSLPQPCMTYPWEVAELSASINDKAEDVLTDVDHFEVQRENLSWMLLTVISRCRALRFFAYDVRPSALPESPAENFYEYIMGILEPYASTLTTLHFRRDDLHSDEQALATMTKGLDFSHFESLAVLKAPFWMFHPGDVLDMEPEQIAATVMQSLPPRLQRLALLLGMSQAEIHVVVCALVYVLEQKHVACPSLTQLDLYIPSTSWWQLGGGGGGGEADVKEIDASLCSVATTNGVQLRVFKCKPVMLCTFEDPTREPSRWGIDGEIEWGHTSNNVDPGEGTGL